jgi:hypothetical protein
MISQDELADLPGVTAHDRSGICVGRVGRVLYDEGSGAPTWVTVDTGLFGAEESFVPLLDAHLHGRTLILAHDVQRIAHAPRLPEDGYLGAGQEDELYRFYGLADDDVTGTGAGGRPPQAGVPSG